MVAQFLFIPLTSLKLTLFNEALFTNSNVRIGHLRLCASDPKGHA